MSMPEQKDPRNNGRWTKTQHEKFLLGLQLYGKNWKKIEQLVVTRTGAQIRSHAQKFFLKGKNPGEADPLEPGTLDNLQLGRSVSVNSKQLAEFQENNIDPNYSKNKNIGNMILSFQQQNLRYMSQIQLQIQIQNQHSYFLTNILKTFNTNKYYRSLGYQQIDFWNTFIDTKPAQHPMHSKIQIPIPITHPAPTQVQDSQICEPQSSQWQYQQQHTSTNIQKQTTPAPVTLSQPQYHAHEQFKRKDSSFTLFDLCNDYRQDTALSFGGQVSLLGDAII